MIQFPLFKEYIAQLPPEVVFKHFLSRQDQTRKILSSSSVNDIVHKMSSEKSIGERFFRLSVEGQYTCGLVYLVGKRGLALQTVPGFDDELLSSFLIFAGKMDARGARYFGFSEFEAQIAPLAAQAIIDKAKTTVAKEPAHQPVWQCLCDVAVLCACASAGQLKMTKKAEFSKVSESAMKKFLAASHEMPSEETALLRRMLFNYALDKELLVFDNETYRSIPQNVLQWMALPLAERYQGFCEFAFAESLLWNKRVLDSLLAGEQRQWLNLPLSDETSVQEVRQSLSHLRYLGLIDICKSGGSLAFARRKPDALAFGPEALAAGRIMLLPDFSAVLTREALPEDLYWFSKLGSLESFDRVFKGTIIRDVVHDSLSEGLDGAGLVQWLEGRKAPLNVLVTVKEWIREFSRMYITSDATVVSAEYQATSQLLSYEPLKRLIEPLKADRVFRIRPGHEQEVRRILISMGFDPRMPGESAGRKGQRNVSERESENGILFTEDIVAPVTRFGGYEKQENRPVKEGKYGQKLKELDMSDLYHVLDYAVLMGHPVSFEYRGSPLVRKGMYKALPLNVYKTPEPTLEGEVLPNKTKKKFLLKCIIRIGVETQ